MSVRLYLILQHDIIYDEVDILNTLLEANSKTNKKTLNRNEDYIQLN